MKTCVICFDQFGDEALLKPVLCTHYCCRSCLARYIIASQESPKYNHAIISCPVPVCSQGFDLKTVYRVLNLQQGRDWWHNAIEKKITNTSGYCPYQDCRGVFELYPIPCSWCATLCRFIFPWIHNRNKNYARCFSCHRGICMKCVGPWHLDGQKCPGKPDKDRKRNTPLMDACLADAKFQELAQSQGWTQCPNCGYVVCKTNGCNVVKCRCGKEFCYRCGSKARNHVCVHRCHKINQAELKRIRRINMHRSQ